MNTNHNSHQAVVPAKRPWQKKTKLTKEERREIYASKFKAMTPAEKCEEVERQRERVQQRRDKKQMKKAK